MKYDQKYKEESKKLWETHQLVTTTINVLVNIF